MTLEEAKNGLKELQTRQFAYNHAMSVINYDAATAAPADTEAPRSVTLGVLSEASYELAAGEKTLALLDSLAEHMDELTPAERRQTELMQKDVRELRRIPVEEYVAYTRLINEAEAVWHRAKPESDYAAFEPYLAKIVDYNRRFAALVAPDKAPYDYCLDNYEEGLTMEKCDAFFGVLREKLVPAVKKYAALPQPESAFMRAGFPAGKQRELSLWLMELMGLDMSHCALGVTEHPFTTEFSKNDVRITTHFHEHDFAAAMYSTIHESGHALYELHTADAYAYTNLGSGVSMGVHECQSRFYENILGRSREFVGFISPKLAELCPELASCSAEEIYRAVNLVTPSLVRTEADEFTYFLHIMVRYELERDLISGKLNTRDLPERWNELYRDYLGVEVPDARRGVLQDSHWSGGSIGYFPSYALGSAYGAQLAAKMGESVDISACLSRGDFSPINSWLEEHIWRHGSLVKPTELMESVFGAPFDPNCYVNYLLDKARDVYGV